MGMKLAFLAEEESWGEEQIVWSQLVLSKVVASSLSTSVTQLQHHGWGTRGGGIHILSQLHIPETSLVLERHPPAPPGGDLGVAESQGGLGSQERDQSHGGGHARVWGRRYLQTCKKYFSILTLVALHQCRHLNFNPGHVACCLQLS